MKKYINRYSQMTELDLSPSKQLLQYINNTESIDMKIVSMLIGEIEEFDEILSTYLKNAKKINVDVVNALAPHTVYLDDILALAIDHTHDQKVLDALLANAYDTDGCYYKLLRQSFEGYDYPLEFFIGVAEKIRRPDVEFSHVLRGYALYRFEDEYLILLSKYVTKGSIPAGCFLAPVRLDFPQEALCNVAEFIRDDTGDDYLCKHYFSALAYYANEECDCCYYGRENEFDMCDRCRMFENHRYMYDEALKYVIGKEDLHEYVHGYNSEFAKKLNIKTDWKPVKTNDLQVHPKEYPCDSCRNCYYYDFH